MAVRTTSFCGTHASQLSLLFAGCNWASGTLKRQQSFNTLLMLHEKGLPTSSLREQKRAGQGSPTRKEGPLPPPSRQAAVQDAPVRQLVQAAPPPRCPALSSSKPGCPTPAFLLGWFWLGKETEGGRGEPYSLRGKWQDAILPPSLPICPCMPTVSPTSFQSGAVERTDF